MSKRKKRAESKDFENQLKRALADYANLQKRVEQEESELIKFGKINLIIKLLGTLDNLEKAEEVIQKQNLESTKQGVSLALKEFKKILENEGVKEIDASDGFDPRFHEAVGIVVGKVDNKVAEVVEKGYRLGEKILRPAKVKVTKKTLVQPSSQAQKEMKAGDYM